MPAFCYMWKERMDSPWFYIIFSCIWIYLYFSSKSTTIIRLKFPNLLKQSPKSWYCSLAILPSFPIYNVPTFLATLRGSGLVWICLLQLDYWGSYKNKVSVLYVALNIFAFVEVGLWEGLKILCASSIEITL